VALELKIGDTALRRWVARLRSKPDADPQARLKRSEWEELVELPG
jgi:hypothetical protein